MSEVPKLTGEELLQQENIKLSNEIQDIHQQNIALNADKDKLIRENARLINEIEQFELNIQQLEFCNRQLVDRNNELVEINNALKIVFNNDDTRNFFKQKMSLMKNIIINMIIIYSSIFLFFIICNKFEYTITCMPMSYK
ncbi:23359_t:CDS:1 [Cetraspora pellucida]|uniref:23359_t:CDS:1 n=1 Tax=Cetraspora pellucida TaxID=1433469 RepID=A0A9N9NS49_9GLOM|nr:23359_t:CDS:1 [Cetraspora pellucida]